MGEKFSNMTGAFGTSNGEPSVEREPEEKTPERKRIKKELTIIVPKDFHFSEEGFRDSLQTICLRQRPRDSIEAFREQGYDYSEEREYPTPIHIYMREVIGTESKTGWSGLVEGVGEDVPGKARTQTIQEAAKQAKAILEMEPDERNKLLDGIELVQKGSGGFREFYVDSDGRHRLFSLKGLADMGCSVSISGLKVPSLVRK